jgi:hypothetical protein
MPRSSTPEDYAVYEADGSFFAMNNLYRVTSGPFPTEAAAWAYVEQNCRREAEPDAAAARRNQQEGGDA